MSTFIYDDRLIPPEHGGYRCCTDLWRDVLPFLRDHLFQLLFAGVVVLLKV